MSSGRGAILGVGLAMVLSLTAFADDLPIKLVSMTSVVRPGAVVTLIIQTRPGASCEGDRQGHRGNDYSIKLLSHTVGSDGLAQWQWSMLSGNHPIGVRGVRVTCVDNGQRRVLATTFNVR